MNFDPVLFISVGLKNCYFTLRETYQYYDFNGNEKTSSFHHFNLSQDPNEAYEKAEAHADRMGLPLKSSLESIQFEMNEIKRKSKEELERAIAEQERKEKETALRLAQEKIDMMNLIKSGIFANGKYRNKPFTDADRGYITWLADNVDTFEEGSIQRYTAEQVIEQVPEMIYPKPTNGIYVGEPKKRMDFEVIVTKTAYFQKQRFNGYGYDTYCVATMVDKKTNACLVSMSSAFFPEQGQEMKIKGTVKDHSEYKGQTQTIIQRIKEI